MHGTLVDLCLKTFEHYPQPGGGRLCRRPEHPLAGVHHRRRGRQGLSASPSTAESTDTLAYSSVLCAFPAPTSRISCARSNLRPSWFLQEGEFCARYEKFNITVPIPKIFYHQSFEAEEVAKELTKKIKAEEDAKEMAKKSAASKRAAVAPTKKKTHQKPVKDTKTTERTTAPAPAKEDAPV